jgi:hypothetical protein
MPISKNRNKKKKKVNTKKKIDKEIFDDGWMRFERQGKNIFMSNSMSEEEHAAWLKQLKANRPLFYLDIRKQIDKLVATINSYDKIFVLGGISSYATQKMMSDENDDGVSEIAMEYCQSIALSSNNISSLRPNADHLKEIFESLVKAI